MRFDVIVHLLEARSSLIGSATRHAPAVTSLGNGYNAQRITSMDGLRAFLGGGR